MLHTAKSFEGKALHATDGDIGHLKDLYFDDEHWHVRYFVVETERGLSSRQVLISPEAIVRGSVPDDRVISVNLTQRQVRESPGIDTAKPVSRQHEAELRHYYGWPPYWGVVLPETAFAPAPPLEPASWRAPQTSASETAQPRPDTAEPPADPHLRSVGEVTGYHIEAIDGAIGHVADFLIDADTWQIRYLIVDTRNWWPGKKVLVAPNWIRNVSWTASTVAVDLTRATIKGSPAYDPSQPVTPAYAGALHDHYGRPRYPDWDPDHKTTEARRNFRG